MSRGKSLEFVEREQIARGIDRNWFAVAIARKLGRDPSVVTREILIGSPLLCVGYVE